ncbi:MAG: CoA transferase [Bdellovibrionales bacterium]|nr:CoA transferase [Bdellovibrionales bacterium]
MSLPPRLFPTIGHSPLSGRLILDCSTLLPGPFVGKLLLDLGAEVVKVEHPSRPDGSLAMGNAYEYLNHGKRIEKLDLAVPAERARFDQLARGAHGLIEGFRPNAKEKLGLTEERLHGINPRLCVASLVGYPEDGPWRDRAGHNLNFEAVTGLLSMFREIPALPLADLFAAYGAALALAASMDQAERTGRGSRSVIAMSEALKDVQGLWIHEYRRSGHVPSPGATLMSGLYPCYRIYVAGCGRRVSVGAIEAKFWKKLCAVLGIPDRIPHGMSLGAEGERTAEAVQRALGSRPWKTWEPLFEAADCCVEAAVEYPEIYAKVGPPDGV